MSDKVNSLNDDHSYFTYRKTGKNTPQVIMVRFMVALLTLAVGSASLSSFPFDSSTNTISVWNQSRLNADLQKLHAIEDNALRLAGSRNLQAVNCTTDPSKCTSSPEQICQSLNNSTAGDSTCTCIRFGEKETQVDCSYNFPQCTSDNSTCYTATISQILNENNQVIVTTTCTTFTTPFNPAKTCIRVFPVVNGTFVNISSCSATYSANTGNMSTTPQVCNSCSVCGSSNTANASTISINCCNAKTDLKQTCGPVSPESGAAIPYFDTIPPSQVGQCSSGKVRSVWSAALFSSAAASVLISLL